MQDEELFTHWYKSGWRASDSPPPCPPWAKVAYFIERKGKAAISAPDALAAARAYTETWQADKDATQLKAKPLWRLADVAVCAGGEEVIRIRIDRAHRLPSGLWLEKHERYPSSERWGIDGFTYTSNSHSDPWAAAFGRVVLLCSSEDEK